MAVRTSMEYIIEFVRTLIHDTDNTNYQFTDQEIQDRLDMHRLDLYQDCLRPADTLSATGYIEWYDFFSRYGFWEEDYLVQTSSGPEAVPDSVELLVGKFHYNDPRTDVLVITGKVYNVYGVAAKLLATWIASVKGQIQSWTADGTTIQRINQVNAMNSLVETYLAMAWGWGNSTQVKLRRRDLRF